MIYLASPYTDPRPSMQWTRWKLNKRALQQLTLAGHHVFSPVFVGHQLAELGVKQDHDWWMKWSFTFLDRSTALWVLTIPGWAESKGVRAEVLRAISLGLPIVGCDIIKEALTEDEETISGLDILKTFDLKWAMGLRSPGK